MQRIHIYVDRLRGHYFRAEQLACHEHVGTNRRFVFRSSHAHRSEIGRRTSSSSVLQRWKCMRGRPWRPAAHSLLLSLPPC
jgi:hypothetical protein